MYRSSSEANVIGAVEPSLEMETRLSKAFRTYLFFAHIPRQIRVSGISVSLTWDDLLLSHFHARKFCS